MKNVLLGLLVFFGLQCALSPNVVAQSSGCPLASWTVTYFPGIIFPPWVFGCQGISTLWSCFYVPPNCPPPAGGSETHAQCPYCSKPISLADGNTYIKQTDITIPGLGGGLTLARTWNSVWPATQTIYQVGLFGPNWRSSFEERIFVGADNYVKYARGDGSFWSFAGSNPLKVAAPANVSATLIFGTTNWTLTFQNGEQRVFSETSGNLIEIIDRNGNATQLTYDSVGRLITVTDPVSRTLSFTYAGPNSLLVTGVTSSAGPTVSYSYDSQNRLLQVTEPDSSTLTFQYNSQSLITSVTDSQGKILEAHTYDSSGRGLTGSRANGVEAVTLSYGNP